MYSNNQTKGVRTPEEIVTKLMEFGMICWQQAANAFRMYPDNKHTFSDSREYLKTEAEKFASQFHTKEEEHPTQEEAVEAEAEKSYPIKQGKPEHFTEVQWLEYLDKRNFYVFAMQKGIALSQRANSGEEVSEAQPVDRGKDEHFAFYDLSGESEEIKKELVNGVVSIASRELLKVFLSCGLKTHIEQMIKNESTGIEYVLSFRTFPEHMKYRAEWLNNGQAVQASVATGDHSSNQLTPKSLDTTTQQSLKEKIETRIKQLNEADAEFCSDRWNDSVDNLRRQLAREESNKVTFARQELQEVLKWLDESPTPSLNQYRREEEGPCDAMGHYGGEPLPEGNCPKCGKSWGGDQATE